MSYQDLEDAAYELRRIYVAREGLSEEIVRVARMYAAIATGVALALAVFIIVGISSCVNKDVDLQRAEKALVINESMGE
jgi:hypothetical protein